MAGLLGLPSSSRWVLQGPYRDPSLVHTAFLYNVSRQIGREAPRTAFLELHLQKSGGELDYRGVYVLVEALGSALRQPSIAQDLTGPYVLRFGKPEAGQVALAVAVTPKLYVDVPGSAEMSVNATVRLSRSVRALEVALGRGDGTYSKFLEVGSWVDHLLLQELARNPDVYHASHLTQPRAGGLEAGPVWSSGEGGFGATGTRGASLTKGWLLDMTGVPWWWRALIESADGCFAAKVASRWHSLRRGVFNTTRLLRTFRHLAQAAGEGGAAEVCVDARGGQAERGVRAQDERGAVREVRAVDEERAARAVRDEARPDGLEARGRLAGVLGGALGGGLGGLPAGGEEEGEQREREKPEDEARRAARTGAAHGARTTPARSALSTRTAHARPQPAARRALARADHAAGRALAGAAHAARPPASSSPRSRAARCAPTRRPLARMVSVVGTPPAVGMKLPSTT